jgi:hypothetical protein
LVGLARKEDEQIDRSIDSCVGRSGFVNSLVRIIVNGPRPRVWRKKVNGPSCAERKQAKWPVKMIHVFSEPIALNSCSSSTVCMSPRELAGVRASGGAEPGRLIETWFGTPGASAQDEEEEEALLEGHLM